MTSSYLDTICWNEQGLVPTIAQDYLSGKVLMVAWMNRQALELSVAENRAIYWSRSRQKIWRKGEESGHIQIIRDIHLDCDNDVLLLSVEQKGGIACHTGRESCFFQQLKQEQWHNTAPILKDPKDIYQP